MAMKIRLDPDQRFACRQCGRCCRGWDIAVCAEDVVALRALDATRSSGASETMTGDPFVKGRLGRVIRLRKDESGRCCFLMADDRCRIHAEWGLMRKPLACRMFPYQFAVTAEGVVAHAGWSCPAIAGNHGDARGAPRREIERLAQEWQRTYSPPARALLWTQMTAIEVEALEALRATLRDLLGRAAPGGAVDLRANLLRIADFVDDLNRPQVLRLKPADLTEYLKIMGRRAVALDAPAVGPAPSFSERLLSRGFLFAVAAVRLRLSARSSSQARVMRWWRQARLLLHVHGVGPRIGGIDLRLLRNVTWPPAGDPVWELTRRYLNSAFLTLGCGDHPVATEIHLAAAMLRAAFSLAAMRGSGAIDLEGLELALREASDIEHNASPVLQRLLGFLADGSNPLRAIASGKPV